MSPGVHLKKKRKSNKNAKERFCLKRGSKSLFFIAFFFLFRPKLLLDFSFYVCYNYKVIYKNGGERMRHCLPELVGNIALRERLGEEIAEGALSHAYILLGPKGCGKHTLAQSIAMALACHHRTDSALPLPCGKCPACQKIAQANCPDILTVKREEDKATMGVDVIRSLREDVSVLPNDLEVKIYIIEDAHTMTKQAQNALLLTLEEPPPFVHFLLLCEDGDALLETIRSRAPMLRMQPIAKEELRTYLLSPTRPAVARKAKELSAQSPEDFEALLCMADGRIGRALELLEEKKRTPLLSFRADALALCRLLADGTKSEKLLELLLAFGKAREDVSVRLNAVQQALRDLVVLSRSETAPLLFFTDREQALDLSVRFTASTLLSYVAATDDALDALAANANVRLTILQYLCRLTA